MNIPRHFLVANSHVNTGTVSFRCKLMKRSQKIKQIVDILAKINRQIEAGEDQAQVIPAPCKAATSIIDSPRNKIAPKGSSRRIIENSPWRLLCRPAYWWGKFFGNAIVIMIRGIVAAGILVSPSAAEGFRMARSAATWARTPIAKSLHYLCHLLSKVQGHKIVCTQ